MSSPQLPLRVAPSSWRCSSWPQPPDLVASSIQLRRSATSRSREPARLLLPGDWATWDSEPAAYSAAAVTLIATTSLLIVRTAVFGRWLAWVGAAAALAIVLTNVALSGAIAIPAMLWTIATSVALLGRRKPHRCQG